MIVAHLRRFNQKPEWDVRQVLPIRAFFMSSPHLHNSDEKLHKRAHYGIFAERSTRRTSPEKLCCVCFLGKEEVGVEIIRLNFAALVEPDGAKS